MPGGLLERQDEHAALLAAVATARGGRGCVVLVTGEAGIGKSSLISGFLGGLDGGVEVLLGACDDLLAPAPSGRCATPSRAPVAPWSGP